MPTLESALELITNLEAKVASLEKRLHLIERVVQFDDEEKNASVICQSVCVHDIDSNKNQSSLCLEANDNEIALTINNGGTQRVRLSVPNDDVVQNADLIFYGEPDKMATVLGVHNEGGHLTVFNRAGVPRAQIQGKSEMGAVCTTGDDGSPRALMLTKQDNTSLFELLTPELKPLVSLRTSDEGATIKVAARDNENAAYLGAHKQGNALILGDIETGVSLVNSAQGSQLQIKVPENSRAINFMLSEAGPQISLSNGEGRAIVHLGELTSGGHLDLRSPDGVSALNLVAADEFSMIRAGQTDAPQVQILASPRECQIKLKDSADAIHYSLANTGEGANLVMSGDATLARLEIKTPTERGVSSSVLTLHNESDIAFVRAQNGDAQIVLQCGTEANIGILASRENSQLELCSPDGTPLLNLVAGEEGGGVLQVMGETGSPRAILDTTLTDGGRLQLNRSGGDSAMRLHALDSGGEIEFHDREGQPKLSLPDDLGG